MPTDDYIKRSDAIKALYQGYEKLGLIVYRVSCIEKINKIPAAAVEPKRKTGKWVYYMNRYYKCTACNLYTCIPHNGSAYIPDYEDYFFCPHCGANMDVEPPKEVDDAEVH